MSVINLFLLYLFPNFILMCAMLYGWHKLLGRRINFKNNRLYITLVGVMFVSILNYIITEKFIRIGLLTIVLMIFIKFLFKESIQKSIMIPIFHQLIVFASEIIAFLFINLFLTPSRTIIFLESFVGICVINMLVAIVSIIIVNIKFIKNFCNKIIKLTYKVSINQLVIICLITMLFFNIFVINVYYKIEFQYWVIANIIFIIVLFIVMLFSLKTQNKLNKVYDKYNVAINSLRDFEMMMSKYRIANHENKNLLLTVRAMIINNESDIPKYIDSIVEEKYKDDDKLLFETSVIPSGGLRATIYSEILKIKERKINYCLTIDKNISALDLIELGTNEILDMCKIVCVLIDNAIDESAKLRKKEISIAIYLSNKILNIKVSNNYKEQIQVDRLFEAGYTTKGDGHGYGLSLVKKIIDSNNNFSIETEINKKTFSQILKVKADSTIKNKN